MLMWHPHIHQHSQQGRTGAGRRKDSDPTVCRWSAWSTNFAAGATCNLRLHWETRFLVCPRN